MLDTETKRRIDTARDILVGKVPDPKSQVEQITIALIYKFMDDMDAEAEELGGKRSFFTGEFEKYGWSKLMASGVGGHEVLNLYAEAITKMNENAGIPLLFRDIFKNAYLPYRNPETLKSFLKIIDDFEYDHSERLGDAFEYLLSVLGSQGDAGQFRTPRHIIDFMVKVIDPKKDDTILDPACGTAGFLISSYKHILKSNTKDGKIGAGLTPDERTRLAKNIKGYDISPDMVRLSLVNLYLHGFTDPHIDEYDTLTSEDKWNEYADVILANPPFMSPKGGIKPHKRFSVQSKRSEVLFVDYMAEHLTPNGRAAVIVPEGIIFQSQNAYKQLRKMLVEEYLFAVVSLPAGVFQPYSGVKTSILLMDKNLAKKSDSILFVKIEHDGFDLGAQRRPNGKSDLLEAVRSIVNYASGILNGETFDAENINNVLVVAKEKIGENGDWNFSAERYRDNVILRNSNYEMVKLEEVVQEIKTGFAFGKAKKDSDGIAHLRPMNITEKGILTWEDTKFIPINEMKNIDEYYLMRGDVLFNNTNSKELVGKTCFVDTSYECGFSNHMTRIRSENDKIMGKYLATLLHFMWSKGIFLEKCNKWVGQAGINKSALSELKIPLPPLEIQKEIVAEIEGYQKIIDGARAVVNNYKPHIQINPEWEVVELWEVCDVRDGTHDSPKYVQEGYPLITSKNIKNDMIDFINVNFISKDDLQKINQRSNVDCGDIIMPMIGTIGNPIVVNTKRDFAIKNVALIKFYEISKINNFFLKHVLDSDYFQLQYINNQNGSTQKFISLGFIRKLKIPLPPLETQNHIVGKIDKEQALVNANKELITIFEQKIKDKIASVWGE